MPFHISIHTFVGTFIPVDVTYGPITVRGGVHNLRELLPTASDGGKPPEPPHPHSEFKKIFELEPLHIDLKKELKEIRDHLPDPPKPKDRPPQQEDNVSDDNSNNNSDDDSEYQWDATDEQFKDLAAPNPCARGGGGGGGG